MILIHKDKENEKGENSRQEFPESFQREKADRKAFIDLAYRKELFPQIPTAGENGGEATQLHPVLFFGGTWRG